MTDSYEWHNMAMAIYTENCQKSGIHFIIAKIRLSISLR